MKLYSIRKRHGQWTVCSNDNVLLNFDSYDEAIETARSAVGVLADRIEQPEDLCQNVAGLERVGGRAWRLPRRAM